MEVESCRICGGDGRIGNAFGGSSTTCPGCHGTGRRAENTGLRDVTKTKPSHHRPAAVVAEKDKWPTSLEGSALAKQIRDSGGTPEQKARLIAEIMEHEATHGRCTQTFVKKMRKQIPAAAR